MSYRTGSHILVALVAAASLSWVAGCDGDGDDDCIHCCSCSYDGSPLVYKPTAPGDCTSCAEQCQDLADKDFLGQEFDNVKDIGCPD